jgi:hypothetical protein
MSITKVIRPSLLLTRRRPSVLNLVALSALEPDAPK